MPHHLYWYIRSQDDEFGKAGTPYYVGISSGQIDRRRFAKHREGVDVPHVSSGRNIVVQVYDSEDELKAAEKAFVQEWGRVGIEVGGVLLNRSSGGEFKLDSEWARQLKTKEGQWKHEYAKLTNLLAAMGCRLPKCMDRQPDFWCRKRWGPCNKSKPLMCTRSAFAFWNVLAHQDQNDALYVAAVIRLYELKYGGISLNRWLMPGVAIQALDDHWSPDDCVSFLAQSAPLLVEAD
jgi:hypothetical protein